MAKIHGKNTRVYLSGYDISGDSNSIEPSYAADTVDVSCFSDNQKAYVVGLPDPQIRQQGVYNDGTAAPARIHAVLSPRVGSMVALDVVYGEGQGSTGIGGTVALNEYTVTSAISAAVSLTAAYSGGDTTGAWEFGQTVQAKALVSRTAANGTTGTDFGTAYVAANGTIAFHLQMMSGTGTVTVQSSTAAGTEMTWTDRAAFTLGTAPLAQRVLYSGGTVPQFWRARIDGTGTAFVGAYRRA